MDKKKLILLGGCSGSGKSWISKQLPKDVFYVIEADARNKKSVELLQATSLIPVYTLSIGVSTFIKRNKEIFDISLVVIKEDESVIRERIEGRGGTFTSAFPRRIKRFVALAKQATFSGTANDVLQHIIQIRDINETINT
jgi:dephospho-CoA kinase